MLEGGGEKSHPKLFYISLVIGELIMDPEQVYLVRLIYSLIF